MHNRWWGAWGLHKDDAGERPMIVNLGYNFGYGEDDVGIAVLGENGPVCKKDVRQKRKKIVISRNRQKRVFGDRMDGAPIGEKSPTEPNP